MSQASQATSCLHIEKIMNLKPIATAHVKGKEDRDANMGTKCSTLDANLAPTSPFLSPKESSISPASAQSPLVLKKSQAPSSGLAVPSPQPPPSPTTAAQASRWATKLIRVSESCPASMRRNMWTVDDFDIRGPPLYTGRISAVYHAVDRRSGVTTALKVYKRSRLTDIERVQVSREITLHCSLVHESVIAMYAAWKDDDLVYMALEWAPGGDLYHYMRKTHGGRGIAEELAVPLILQPFLSGLSDIHDKGLIHRDIKPENILLTNSFQIKIADFGLSIDMRYEIANTRLGTIDYLAPEILTFPVKTTPYENKDSPGGGYTSKVDCWSSGVLAYELLVGYAPFSARTPQETLRNIREKTVEYPPHLSPGAVAFMNRLFVRDPNQRSSVAEVLTDPWLIGLCKSTKSHQGQVTIARSNTVGSNLGMMLVPGVKAPAPNKALAHAPSGPLANGGGVDGHHGKKRSSPVKFDEMPPPDAMGTYDPRLNNLDGSPKAQKKARGEVTPSPVKQAKGPISALWQKIKEGGNRLSFGSARPKPTGIAMTAALPVVVERFAELAVGSTNDSSNEKIEPQSSPCALDVVVTLNVTP